MPTYCITRHPGAIAWAKQQDITVCDKGAAYIHLSLNVPEQWRGHELNTAQMVE